MFLTDKLSDEINFLDVTYQLDMAFDNILHLSKMLEAKELSEYEKMIFGLEILVRNFADVETLHHEQQYQLLMKILETKMGFKSNDNESQNESTGTAKKEYDFEIDGKRIYASFLMDYGIDLIEQQGELHWQKFLAMFEGLSDKTPFMQVVQIRNMEVPKADKNNQKDRMKIQKLKRKYELEQPNAEAGLEKAAMFLRRNSKVGGK
ncbi:bacteriophage Gp15 protein [Oceanobacillus picturae]|uniref:Bacteriophage Gp15 protein n=1 Tax=Oceanobacillus picturae TaxID=171693 RepID=A0A0U9H5N2_9BACI|nr:Gp15 family bacteriophage protein [Oceanobacillus picturae]GAQ18037.1 bacteriophage Gp15 protein [Oceanobacillus picturae]